MDEIPVEDFLKMLMTWPSKEGRCCKHHKSKLTDQSSHSIQSNAELKTERSNDFRNSQSNMIFSSKNLHLAASTNDTPHFSVAMKQENNKFIAMDWPVRKETEDPNYDVPGGGLLATASRDDGTDTLTQAAARCSSVGGLKSTKYFLPVQMNNQENNVKIESQITKKEHHSSFIEPKWVKKGKSFSALKQQKKSGEMYSEFLALKNPRGVRKNELDLIAKISPKREKAKVRNLTETIKEKLVNIIPGSNIGQAASRSASKHFLSENSGKLESIMRFDKYAFSNSKEPEGEITETKKFILATIGDAPGAELIIPESCFVFPNIYWSLIKGYGEGTDLVGNKFLEKQEMNTKREKTNWTAAKCRKFFSENGKLWMEYWKVNYGIDLKDQQKELQQPEFQKMTEILPLYLFYIEMITKIIPRSSSIKRSILDELKQGLFLHKFLCLEYYTKWGNLEGQTEPFSSINKHLRVSRKHRLQRLTWVFIDFWIQNERIQLIANSEKRSLHKSFKELFTKVFAYSIGELTKRIEYSIKI